MYIYIYVCVCVCVCVCEKYMRKRTKNIFSVLPSLGNGSVSRMMSLQPISISKMARTEFAREISFWVLTSDGEEKEISE